MQSYHQHSHLDLLELTSLAKVIQQVLLKILSYQMQIITMIASVWLKFSESMRIFISF